MGWVTPRPELGLRLSCALTGSLGWGDTPLSYVLHARDCGGT